MNENLKKSLSEYFANDGPNLFDELVGEQHHLENGNQNSNQVLLDAFNNTNNIGINNTLTNSTANESNPTQSFAMENIKDTTFSGTFRVSNFTKLIFEDEEIAVPEDVRDYWPLEESAASEQLLTRPALMISTDLPDSIYEVVEKHLGHEEAKLRKIPDINNVTEDENGLYSLINVGSYRAAANLTARLLTNIGQGFGTANAEDVVQHTPYSLKLWFARFALLIRIGEYELLQKEAKAFHELRRIDMFYQHYPDRYPGRRGSMASFSFRLLLAELHAFCGNSKMGSNRLSELLLICNEIKSYFQIKYKGQKDEYYKFWTKRELRVIYEIVNCTLLWKKYNLVDVFLRKIVSELPDITIEEQRTAYSAWGRIYLQIGDVFGAEQRFASARRLRTSPSDKNKTDVRNLVDKGLIMVATNNFPEAYSTFQKALQTETGNTMILNNMGVCLLYAGKLNDAIKLYERAIEMTPHKSLNESVIVNLCSLYELELNNSRARKLELMRLINRHKAVFRVNLEMCLKLQNMPPNTISTSIKSAMAVTSTTSAITNSTATTTLNTTALTTTATSLMTGSPQIATSFTTSSQVI